MTKRGKLEIIRDVLKIIRENHNLIRPTPLIRKSNLSSSRFRRYYLEMLGKGMVKEVNFKKSKNISLTERGFMFLEKYKTIVNFIDEFGL